MYLNIFSNVHIPDCYINNCLLYKYAYDSVNRSVKSPFKGLLQW